MERKRKNTEHAGNIKDYSSPFVVGIGASAGGLEALQYFFKGMPLKTGMAFVVIQHLSPDYKSLMNELLARETKLDIHIASDGMDVQPDTIYLIPPRTNLSIFHNQLFLEEQSPKKGVNLPVDVFFRSLALEKGKNAIGIVLSGTGSDGTLGVKAIKEAGGMVMVQDETSAKFDGMPRNAIATGIVDYVLPPSKMPEALIEFIEHPFVKKNKSLKNEMHEKLDNLSKVTLMLRDFCGVDFSYYKENTIIRRLERRLSINRMDNLDDYLKLISDSDKEKEVLHRELLIGVTSFFRDPDAFSIISKKVIPQINYKKNKTIRVWSAGCSTGEEVYSLAILFLEHLEQKGLDNEVKIFATDIDKHSLDVASQGFYPESIAGDIDPALLTKYFKPTQTGYQVKDFVRKMIVFATHNLLKDPPFSKLDLMICRNLFIYFKADIQMRLLQMFYFSLKPESFLFMGSSETIGELTDAFESIDSKWKVFKRKEGYKYTGIKGLPIPRTAGEVPLSQISVKHKPREEERLEKLIQEALSLFLPTSVLVDSNEHIVHIINNKEHIIKLKPGKFSPRLLDNLSHELSLFVNTHLRRLKKGEKEVMTESLNGLKDFKNKNVTIESRAIEIEKQIYFLVSFKVEPLVSVKSSSEVAPIDVDEKYLDRVLELERDLQFTKESLQATVEELETSNEELQSSNEELVASNEELQSTNEELHSVNEELYTVNSEYHNKIEELIRLNNDVTNLLKNTEIGAIYLDHNLCIRKVTPVMTQISNILESDIGRPLSHIASLPAYPALYEDVRTVAENLQPIDKEIKLETGKIFYVRVRPYRTEYFAVEGVLVTFVDISSLKNEIVAHKDLLTNTIESLTYPFFVVDAKDYRILVANHAARKQYTISEHTTCHKAVFGSEKPCHEAGMNCPFQHAMLKGKAGVEEHPVTDADGNVRYLEMHTYPIRAVNGEISSFIEYHIDVTERKKMIQTLKESENHFRMLADFGQALIWTSTVDKKCDYFNRPWLQFTGRTMEQELGDGWIEGVHPEDLEKCMEVYNKAFDAREVFQMNYRLRYHDGSYRWIQDVGTPRYDSKGNFLGYIGHCLDIHENVIIREALTKLEDGIRKQ